MKLIATPRKGRKNTSSALIDINQLSPEDVFFIFSSLIQVLGVTSSSTSRNLPILVPCHKICEEILIKFNVVVGNNDRREETLKKIQRLFKTTALAPHLLCNGEPSLLVACRGFSKVLSKKSSSSSLMVENEDSISQLLFSHLSETAAFSGRFNFLELVESLTLLLKHVNNDTSSSSSNQIQSNIQEISSAIGSAIDQCADILKNVVLVNSSSSASTTNEELSQEDLRMLESLDLRPMVQACEQIITSQSSSSLKQMKESSLKFIVSAFAFEQQEAKRKIRVGITNHQVNYDSSRLGFERSHLAKSAAEKEQNEEIRELGLAVRRCLNLVKSREEDKDLYDVAQKEWKLLMTPATKGKEGKMDQ